MEFHRPQIEVGIFHATQFFFIRNLAPKRVLGFLWKSPFLSTRFLSDFLFACKTRNFLAKKLISLKNCSSVSYEVEIWVLGFSSLKKFEYWFLIKRFLIEKNVYIYRNLWNIHDKQQKVGPNSQHKKNKSEDESVKRGKLDKNEWYTGWRSSGDSQRR